MPISNEAKYVKFFEENQTGLIRTTHFRMTVNPRTIFLYISGTICTVITLNQESAFYASKFVVRQHSSIQRSATPTPPATKNYFEHYLGNLNVKYFSTQNSDVEFRKNQWPNLYLATST